MTINNAITKLVDEELWPALQAEQADLDRIDKWHRWDHESPHTPRHATSEYKELATRAQTPWLGLVVTAIAQALYVEGYQDKSGVAARPWQWWQVNGLDRRQIGIHRAALTYAQSYVSVLPGKTPAGEPAPVIRGHSPRLMTAFYDELDDDFPVIALRAEPAKVDGEKGWKLKVYDAEAVHLLHATSSHRLTYISHELHNAGVCPIIRFAGLLDLEGRAVGEVEPYIPVASRIDQTTMDRLVVQRFGAWVTRTISGMSAPETDEEARATAIKLRVEDLLVSESPDTKFGSMPHTPLDGFLLAHDADVRDLAAVTQTPPHHLLGQVSNISAEALAAAEATLGRKVKERQHAFGESWEQTLRLGAHLMGDQEAAFDFDSQVRWRDVESRSLAQTADALGKMATMLQVPVQELWERIPGVTQQDVAKWKDAWEKGGELEALLREATNGMATRMATQRPEPGSDPDGGF